jgi:hypothetical protein
MNDFDIPPAAKEMADLLTESLKNLNAVQELLAKEMRQYLARETSPHEEERVEGRRVLFFCMTSIRHLNREWNNARLMDLVNEIYKSMCEEFGAGQIEKQIIDALKIRKK